MKTKLYILFLLMFSMNISCLKEGPYISLKSKMDRLTSEGFWVISKYIYDGIDISEQVKRTDSMKFALRFRNSHDNDPEFFSGEIFYPKIYWNQSIFESDSAYCKRVYCGIGSNFVFSLVNIGREIQFEILAHGAPYISNPWYINKYKMGMAVVDNSKISQKLVFDVLRLTQKELILFWEYQEHEHRMEFEHVVDLENF
jgi:hypothetical protein